MLKWALSAVLPLTLTTVAARAELAPLDHAYKNLVHPISQIETFKSDLSDLPSASDVARVIANQTPVKSQKNRGTCSIFSGTALVESMMILTGKVGHDVDLSEEWLQYLTTLHSGEEGSSSPKNFGLLKRYGQPREAAMPYNGETWTNKNKGLAAKRCGHLTRSRALKSCLVSHRDPHLMNMSDAELLDPVASLYDPEFVQARKEALDNRSLFFAGEEEKDGIVRSVHEIHRLLAKGIPLLLDLNFFDGAWNYPGSAKKGIYRSARLWREGVVTHPEKGSKDLALSPKAGEGHSIVVVGYDDNREVEYVMSMKDGSRKRFKRKGVYYFKNSWGSSTWGHDFKIDGVPYPGYGMILQVHAHTHGQFYRLRVPGDESY